MFCTCEDWQEVAVYLARRFLSTSGHSHANLVNMFTLEDKDCGDDCYQDEN